MQKLLFTLCLICLFLTTKAQQGIDVLHYKFNILLNDKNDTIYGQAEIKIKFLQPVSFFTIDLATIDNWKKGMIVDEVLSVRPEIKSYIAKDNKINVFLSHPQKINDSAIFSFYYHGVPSDGLIISKNKYGDRTFFADNWPNRAHNWIPCIDDLLDKASFEFLVTAPSHYKIISNGVKVEEKILPDNKKLTHWKEDISLPTKVMVIGVADFAIKEYADSPPDVPVTAWIFSRDSTKGFFDYSLAPNILKFFSGYIGPYPYKKLANVQSKTIFGGMENAGAIFYRESSVTGKQQDVESLLAHEIAHQWFGDMATEKSFTHLWLSEGFATYLAHIYISSRYGTDSFEAEMKIDREKIIELERFSPKPVVDSVTPYMELLNANRYERGSWILHMLQRQLNDSVFHQIIRSYYETYKGKNADTKDFEAIAEKISGKDLGYFFKQWPYTSQIPNLIINWSYDDKEKKLSVSVEQMQNTEPFIFPLEILIESESGKNQIETLAINKKKQTFTFSIPRPSKIIADPDTSLLFDGRVKEPK